MSAVRLGQGLARAGQSLGDLAQMQGAQATEMARALREENLARFRADQDLILEDRRDARSKAEQDRADARSAAEQKGATERARIQADATRGDRAAQREDNDERYFRNDVAAAYETREKGLLELDKRVRESLGLMPGIEPSPEQQRAYQTQFDAAKGEIEKRFSERVKGLARTPEQEHYVRSQVLNERVDLESIKREREARDILTRAEREGRVSDGKGAKTGTAATATTAPEAPLNDEATGAPDDLIPVPMPKATATATEQVSTEDTQQLIQQQQQLAKLVNEWKAKAANTTGPGALSGDKLEEARKNVREFERQLADVNKRLASAARRDVRAGTA